MPGLAYDATTERAVAALEQRWREKFTNAMNDISLRRWCVEEACKHAKGPGDVIELAKAIHDFITAGIVATADQ